MGRTILAVVGSFIFLNVLVFAALTAAWSIFGADGAFKPASWETSGTWVATMLGVSLAAAVLGGAVCRFIAGRDTAPMHLAIILLLAGVLTALSAPPPAEPPAGANERPSDVPMMEAMQSAQPPRWYAWAVAVIGPVGVIVGGTLLASGRGGGPTSGPDAPAATEPRDGD